MCVGVGVFASGEPACGPFSHSRYVPLTNLRPSQPPGHTSTLTTTNSYVRLRRRVQGIINRLSEANLDPLSTELVGLFDTNSTGMMNKALTTALMTIASTDSQVRCTGGNPWRVTPPPLPSLSHPVEGYTPSPLSLLLPLPVSPAPPSLRGALRGVRGRVGLEAARDAFRGGQAD